MVILVLGMLGLGIAKIVIGKLVFIKQLNRLSSNSDPDKKKTIECKIVIFSYPSF